MGRSWRENETLGNLKQESLSSMVNKTEDLRKRVVHKQFDPKEETRRKFHLNNPSAVLIKTDKQDVKSVESGNTKPVYDDLKSAAGNKEEYDEIFYLPLQDSPQKMAQMLILEPKRYRLRKEGGFGFLFDRQSFNITMLRQDELDEIDKNMPDKYNK